MLNSEYSTIDLLKIIEKNKTAIELNILMTKPTSHVSSLTKDFLQSITSILNNEISESLKTNIIATNKNPKFKECVENYWKQFEEPHIKQEELIKTFSFKSF